MSDDPELVDRLFATVASEPEVIDRLSAATAEISGYRLLPRTEIVERLKKATEDLRGVQQAKLMLSRLDASQIRAGLDRRRAMLGGGGL